MIDRERPLVAINGEMTEGASPAVTLKNRYADAVLKAGGVLVYSTCSLEHEENTAVVEQIARELPELALEEVRTSLPFRDAVDGSFAARFRKL